VSDHISQQTGFRTTRRNILLGFATSASAGMAWRAFGSGPEALDDTQQSGDVAAPTEKGADGLRPFAWTDALMRSEINAADVSVKGDVALVIIRPLGAKGVHFSNTRPAVTSRGELWLGNADLSSCRKLELGDRWVWSPLFSPSGEQLAALTTAGDGRVALAVWNLVSGQVRLHDAIHVDIFARFRTVARMEHTSGFGQRPLAFVWSGEDRILFIAASPDPSPFDELAGFTSARTHASLRSKTFGGEASIRTWSPQGPTCFVGRQLMSLETATGETSALYAGDIRGVSLSGDARWAAILRADRHVAIAPDARQSAPLWFTDAGDDPMVSCSLACVRLHDGAAFDVPGIDAVGNVAPSRLPVWSSDSRRFAVAKRSSYSSEAASGDDACWEVDVVTRSVRSWPAVSVADAEFIAALVAANEAADANAGVQGRQPLADPPMGSGGGQVMARSWALAPGLVAKWVGETLSLVHGVDERVLTDECSSVASPVATSDGGQLLLVSRKDGRFEAINVRDGQHRGHLLDMPANASLLCAGRDGRVLCKRDADDGSRLYLALPGAPAVASPFVLNRHLAEVRRPRAREVVRTTADGKRLTGILMTPTNTSAGTQSPVILWAYPNSVPRLDGWMSRINDGAAVSYPFQHLLAQGFAVFQAPLPMSDRPDDADPLDYVSDLIVPWLDVLDQQPEVQAGQYGFWGHSDAGYAALALLATTDRFKAIAAASTFPDLAATVYSARLPFETADCAAHLIQTNRWYYEAETQHYRVGGSLWRNADGFVRNSALFHLERAVTPTLLMVGEFDAAPRSMEEVYSALHGKGVPVELAYYWGEGHVISSPGNLHDLWTRSEQFFRRYLPLA